MGCAILPIVIFSPVMIIEFQISASAFLDAQKATLESAKFCAPPIIQPATAESISAERKAPTGPLKRRKILAHPGMKLWTNS
jgi:hypothetical protein